MGSISIGLPRSSGTVQLDGSGLQNASSCLVCFLYYCSELPANSPHCCRIICRGCDFGKGRGICLCRRITPTGAFSLARCFSQLLLARRKQQSLTVPVLPLLMLRSQ